MTSKPTWSNTSGYSATSAFFVFLGARVTRGQWLRRLIRNFLARMGDTMTHGDDKTLEKETRLEMHLQVRLGSRVRNLRVVCRNDGVIIQGSAGTYYAKQLAQHAVMEITNLPVLANEIEVC